MAKENRTDQAERIKNMLTCFVDIEDVAKAERLSKDELDILLKAEFDMPADEAVEVFRAQGKARLHLAQLLEAENGSNQMLTLLGKQYLGQDDEAARQKTYNDRERGTVLGEVLDFFSGAPDRKSKTAH